MDADKFFTKVAKRTLTRRDVAKAFAAAGLVMATRPFVPRPARAAGDEHPTLFTWSGYEVPEMHQSYIAKYGESPNSAVWADEEEAFLKIRAGFQPDMTMPCSYKITPWHDAGILAPIDFSRLSNWPDVLEPLRDVPDTSFGAEDRPWVCAWWGLTAVTYRTDLVEPKEDSWGLLWDERYAGKLAMFGSLIDGVMAAAIYAGAKNPFDMTPDEVAKVRELMVKQKPLLRYYINAVADLEQSMAAGEVVAGASWNDSPLRLLQQGVPVRFMSPKEGAMTWTCGLSLMKDADPAKLDRTYDLLDAYLTPETGEYFIMSFGMGHSNKKAFERVSEEDLAMRGLPQDPTNYLKSGIFQATIRNEPELNAMFEEVKAGL